MDRHQSACGVAVDKRDVRNRAVVMAIRTGDVPDVDLIWSIQEHEGHTACFGQRGYCYERKACRWGAACGQMAEVEEFWSCARAADQALRTKEAVPSEPGLAEEEVPVWMAQSKPMRVPPQEVVAGAEVRQAIRT